MTSDKKDDDVNDTSFIDKTISETTEPRTCSTTQNKKKLCL
jgi:hypothetical protein